jgi:hypothetical protein
VDGLIIILALGNYHSGSLDWKFPVVGSHSAGRPPDPFQDVPALETGAIQVNIHLDFRSSDPQDLAWFNFLRHGHNASTSKLRHQRPTRWPAKQR